MTCPTASRLRLALYAISTQYGNIPYPLPDAIKNAIIHERERPEYQSALEALREHFRECETCRQSY